jgi:hypothetical protein
MTEPAGSHAALARWLASGVTSISHPLLREALERCFHPIGIEADWLEAEPFGGAEAIRCCWLRRPRWNPARIPPAHPATADLAPWASDPAAVHVDCAGFLHLPSPRGGADLDPAASWRAVRHSVGAGERAAAFIRAAAGLVLAGSPLAAGYASGDDAGFAAAVWRCLENPATAPAAHGGSHRE